LKVLLRNGSDVVVAGLLPGEAGGHQPDHRDFDEAFGVGDSPFVVAA